MAKIELERKEVVAKEIEVLSCPFCNGDNLEIVYDPGSFGYSSAKSHVKCKNCGACGGEFVDNNCRLGVLDMKEIAVKRWNRRSEKQ